MSPRLPLGCLTFQLFSVTVVLKISKKRENFPFSNEQTIKLTHLVAFSYSGHQFYQTWLEWLGLCRIGRCTFVQLMWLRRWWVGLFFQIPALVLQVPLLTPEMITEMFHCYLCCNEFESKQFTGTRVSSDNIFTHKMKWKSETKSPFFFVSYLIRHKSVAVICTLTKIISWVNKVIDTKIATSKTIINNFICVEVNNWWIRFATMAKWSVIHNWS